MTAVAAPPCAAHRPPALAELDARLRGGLVVSVQPVDGGPLDDDTVVARMAQAALAGGAAALRIEGARRLAVVRSALPGALLIGIVKRDLADSPVRITPFVEDVRALAEAGADIVAVDVTARPRPAPVAALLAAIRAAGCHAMADASDEADALAAADAGFAIVGSTLAGYTGPPDRPVPEDPDLELVRRLASRGLRVMAEGRYDTPARAAQAMAAGAWAVTVGSALTRLEVATGWFAAAVRVAAAETPGKR